MSSTSPDDGGPIFPCNSPIHQGMSLRDWLAGQALAGFTRVREGAEMFNEHTTRWYARIAYSLADAMLLERVEGRAPQADLPLQKAVLRGDIPDMPVPTAWPAAVSSH